MSDESGHPRAQQWARLRFAVVGPLLASPPAPGELRAEIERLAQRRWQHPITGAPLTLGFSTIERWLYTARAARRDPVAALRQQVRKDAGAQPSLSLALRELIRRQYQEHPGWTVKLHVDNLAVRVDADATLGSMPSYQTVRRFMRREGLRRQRRPRHAQRRGWERAHQRREQLEVRSFEATHVHSLWHADFHHGSRKLLGPDGRWHTPRLLGFLDDHSRLVCHLQWYLEETAHVFVHGLGQAIQKRGLPRALMTDNGAPMLAAETVAGLERLGIVHERTLPYSAYQNGKQEHLWALVEGRLMAMLEGVEDLTLAVLNETTQAWVELEYHRTPHTEIGCPPLDRFLHAPSVGRPSPSTEELKRAFRATAVRTQRRSDGTVSLRGRRFEVPARYGHLDRLHLRYASWDLSRIELVDAQSGAALAALVPLDKTRNADGRRRVRAASAQETNLPPSGMAPLLRQLLADYAATGLPPAYLPMAPNDTDDEEESDT